jgi:hypothetical protein
MPEANTPHNPGLSPKAWEKVHQIMSEINRKLVVQQQAMHVMKAQKKIAN